MNVSDTRDFIAHFNRISLGQLRTVFRRREQNLIKKSEMEKHVGFVPIIPNTCNTYIIRNENHHKQQQKKEERSKRRKSKLNDC